MNNHQLAQELHKACTAKAPHELMMSYHIDEEITVLQEYFGCKFNNLQVDNRLENNVKEMGYSVELGFDKWLSERIEFYKNRWEEMTKYEGEILGSYDFMSETFKILDKCSWWVQNVYQPFSGAKHLLHGLDCIAARFEREEQNKKTLVEKANKFCDGEKDWRGKSQQELNQNEREKERQVFAFFAELKTADELGMRGFTDIHFLQEGKNKMPDISADKEGEMHYAEVKRIQNPRDEDEALRSTRMHSGDVNQSFRAPLQKKIGDFICDAKEKFAEQNATLSREQKLLSLDFEPGIDARLSVNFNATLNEIFGDGYFTSLEQTHDITILPTKYF